MAEDDLREQIRALSEKMEGVESSLRTIAEPYAQLMEYLERFQGISSSYLRLLDLYQRYGEISPDLLVPDVKDAISREIVKILFEKDGQNISRITDRLKDRRGTASRRIVRERLKVLEEKGVVRRKGASKNKEYWLSEEFVERWYRLLGLKGEAPKGER